MKTTHRHHWTADASIGCAENPGCRDIGNGHMTFAEVCACGAKRLTMEKYAKAAGAKSLDLRTVVSAEGVVTKYSRFGGERWARA